MNDANIENTGKYAVAGGNLEIIHICEKNHSSFKGAYKAAIEFHRNDIFKYLYEEKIEGHIPFNLVGDCIVYSNYDILQILFKKIIYIEPIKLTVSTGNLFLTEYFLQENQSNLKKDYLFSAIKSGNYELVNYLIDKYKFDINFPSIYRTNTKFRNII